MMLPPSRYNNPGKSPLETLPRFPPLGILVLLVGMILSGCQTAGALDGTQPPMQQTITATQPPSPSPSAAPTLADAASAVPTTTPTLEPDPSSAMGDADVLFVRATYDESSGTWAFEVTVSHPDTGWEDYADGWDIVGPDGTVYKPDPASPFTRLLLHPHVDEQPFTRSQRGVAIPGGITVVYVRAHDLIAGFGGREVLVDLTAESGPDFEVRRSP